MRKTSQASFSWKEEEVVFVNNIYNEGINSFYLIYFKTTMNIEVLKEIIQRCPQATDRFHFSTTGQPSPALEIHLLSSCFVRGLQFNHPNWPGFLFDQKFLPSVGNYVSHY
jgi:hypothetical protein